jgi:hypothetical protein
MRNKLILLGSLMSGVVSTACIIASMRQHSEKMAQIQADYERDIEIIKEVKETMLDRVRNGDYRGKSYEEIETDFQFEIIARTNDL